MNRKRMISNFLLLVTAVIWGVAFVAQSVGMDYIGPCTFAFSRFLIGGIMLLPVIKVMDHNRRKNASREDYINVRVKKIMESSEMTSEKDILKKAEKEQWKLTVTAGICCGLALSTASLAQQYGIMYTSVGKAGFITTLYIIIVPLLGLFVRKKIPVKVWISAAIAVFGLYMICMSETFSLSRGDSMVLLCAFLFSIQILLVDFFSPKADPVKISCIQFFTCAVVCGVGTLIFENPTWADMMAAAVPILYAGVMSSGVAYTLQVVAQRNTDSTVASLIMSLESVIATLAGWFLLGQHLSVKELFGCALVFTAIILAQLPDKCVIKTEC
ncbi:MAG: DMT family transporter [Lachnospiraceae bacterium]|nr:DMT family transporter [Lachnospiraceae bacterium]